MIQIKYFTFNPFGENTYILSDDTKACIVVDPGCYEKVEQETLKNYISENGLKVEKVVNTHCHIDHVLGNRFVKETYNAPIWIPEGEKEVHKANEIFAPAYGFQQYSHLEADHFLENKGKLTFGGSSLNILFVPGHAPGHLAFYSKEGKFCINGDVLFRGSVGRSDLPLGNHEQLMDSIQNVMFKLPEDTVVYCGHGPETDIAFEKRNNPFCAVL